MRIEIGAALLAAITLAGCMGPHGNPNGRPYATESGGSLAVSPQAIGTVTYDPYGKAPSFADIDIGSAAITPSPPPPMNFTPPGASPAPQRNRQRSGPTPY
ncbi:MAG TPA: hypothetical protein VGG66_00465 [Rhizomicrobium sp.]|jgi:hypothetical protein